MYVDIEDAVAHGVANAGARGITDLVAHGVVSRTRVKSAGKKENKFQCALRSLIGANCPQS